MAIQFAPLVPWLVRGGIALGATTLGGLGLYQAGKNRDERDEEAAARAAREAYQNLGEYVIGGGTRPPVNLPQIVLPDYGASRGATMRGFEQGVNRITDAFGQAQSQLESGYGSAAQGIQGGFAAGRQGLTDAYGQFRGDLTGAYESRGQGIQQFRDELGNMFNFGEDPYARALLDFTQGDIGARREAATQATRTAFDAAVAEIMARGGNIDPAAAAAQVQASFDAAAAAAAASNASTAADIAASQQGVVGVGPATGEAADIQQAITGGGAISAEAARANAQIAREAMDYLASSATRAGAARQGELENLAMAAQAEATRQFMAAEQQRIAREREAYRQVEMGLRSDQLMLDSQLQEQLASAGFDVNRILSDLSMQEGLALGDLSLSMGRDLSGLATQEGTTLGGLDIERGRAAGDFARAEEEARIAAENFWARERGEMAIADEEQRIYNETLLATIDANLTRTAQREDRNGFADKVEQMLANPEQQPFLYMLGIFDRRSASAAYDAIKEGMLVAPRNGQDPRLGIIRGQR